jgi:hypothetical protein
MRVMRENPSISLPDSSDFPDEIHSIKADRVRLREAADRVLWEFRGPDGFIKTLNEKQRKSLEHLEYIYKWYD